MDARKDLGLLRDERNSRLALVVDGMTIVLGSHVLVLTMRHTVLLPGDR